MKKILYILLYFISLLSFSYTQQVCVEVTQGAQQNLICPNNTTIISVDFDSYGLPSGTCGNYQEEVCHCSPNTDGWVGTNNQIVSSGDSLCGNPCGGDKHRYVQVTCGVSGCTDNTAVNYDALATNDDGSCEFAPQLIAEIPDVSENEDSENLTIDLSVHFSDLDGDNITYNANYNGSSGNLVNLTEVSGNDLILSFCEHCRGSGSITVTATDNDGSIDDVFNISVNAVNDGPVITSVNSQVPTLTNDNSPHISGLIYEDQINIQPNSLLTVVVFANDDVDSATQLTYSIDNPIAGMSINSDNSFEGIFEYDIPADAVDFSFTLRVSDGNVNDDALLNISVVIDGTSQSPIIYQLNQSDELEDSYTLDEDENFILDFYVQNFGQGDIPLSGVDAILLLDSISNGTSSEINNLDISIEGSNNFRLTINPDDNWNGNFDVLLQVFNSNQNSDTHQFTVNYTPINDDPILYNLADKTIDEDDINNTNTPLYLYVYDVDTEILLNLNPVSYSDEGFHLKITNNDVGEITENFFSESNAGNYSGSRLYSYGFANNREHWNGSEQFTVSYTDSFSDDGIDNDTFIEETFNVIVAQTNDGPDLEEIADPPAFNEEEDVVVSLQVSDIDSNINPAPPAEGALNNNSDYDLANINLSVSFASPTTGENFDNYFNFSNTAFTSSGESDLTITPITDFNKTTRVTVTVTDDGNASDVEQFDITINQVNDSPILTDHDNEVMDDILEDEDSQNPDDVVFYIYDVDTDPTLNQNPDDYDGVGTAFDLQLQSNGTEITANPLGTSDAGNKYRYPFEFSNVREHWNGTEEFTITYTDGELGGEETFNVTISKVNDAPEMQPIDNPDAFDEETSIIVNFQALDVDSNYDPPPEGQLNDDNQNPYNLGDLIFTASAASPTGDDFTNYFTLDIIDTNNADGTAQIEITPIINFNRTTVITINVTDEGQLTHSTSFTITINQVNDSPVLYDNDDDEIISDIEINEDDDDPDVFNFYLYDVDTSTLLNESPDLYTQNFSITIPSETEISSTPGGASTVNIGGKDKHRYPFEFDNIRNHWNGTEEFTLTYTDGDASNPLGGTETFNVKVIKVNDTPEMQPIDNPDAFDEDTSITVNFQAFDVDSNYDPPAEGQLNADDQIPYDLASLNFTASVESPAGDDFSIYFTLDFQNDNNIDGTGELVVTPVENFNKTSVITITAIDEENLSNSTSFTITINQINDNPIIEMIYNIAATDGADIDVPVDEDDSVNVVVIASDIDSSEEYNQQPITLDNLTFNSTGDDFSSITLVPTNVQGEATITYTPDPDFDETALVTLIVEDSGPVPLLQDTFDFELVVEPAGDPPVLDDIEDLTISEDTTTNPIDIIATDVDDDNIYFNITLVSVDVHTVDNNLDYFSSIFNYDTNPPTLTITPIANFNGNLTFTVTAYDALELDGAIIDGFSEDNFVLTVTSENDKPIAHPFILDGGFDCGVNSPNLDCFNCEDGVIYKNTIGLSNNASNTLEVELGLQVEDVDSTKSLNLNPFDMSTLIFSVTIQPTHTVDGNLVDPFGNISFDASKAHWIPYPDYNGTVTFSYKVNDTQEDSDPAEVSFKVRAINDQVAAFTIINDIHDNIVYPENIDVTKDYLGNEFIKFPDYQIDDGNGQNIVLDLNDIDETNIKDYYEYMNDLPYQTGNVTFNWNRSSDIDTHSDLNEYWLGDTELFYRIELVDETNTIVYVIADQIPDEGEGNCDLDGDGICSIDVNLSEGPYNIYDYGEYYHYLHEQITSNIIVDGSVKYRWRVTAQDYVNTYGVLQNESYDKTFNDSDSEYNTADEDFYYIDLTQPSLRYDFIMNDIYNNYFDMYVQAIEDVVTNPNAYFVYLEDYDNIMPSTVNATTLSPHPRVFLVDDYFNNPGQIYFYFASADMLGNIKINKKSLIFDLITYDRVNSFSSSSGLMSFDFSRYSSPNSASVLIYEEDVSVNEELISDVVTVNSNIDLTNTSYEIRIHKENLPNDLKNNFENIHIVTVNENNIEKLPTYRRKNEIFCQVDFVGSFGIAIFQSEHLELPYETKIISAYPNPFNPTITIDYHLEGASYVEIDVFNILGQRVVQLYEGIQKVGPNTIIWNGVDQNGVKVASGNYIMKIKNKYNTLIQNVILLK